MSNRYGRSGTARFVKNTAMEGRLGGITMTAQQLVDAAKTDEIDTMMGFERYIPPIFEGRAKTPQEIPGRVGWLSNMHATIIPKQHSQAVGDAGISGVDFYFLDEEGGSFKSTVTFDPYFLVECMVETRVNDAEEFLRKHLEHCLKKVEVVIREDLSMSNHLLGLKRTLLKLSFTNVSNLHEARKLLRPIFLDNEAHKLQRSIYEPSNIEKADVKVLLTNIREYDVPYHVRVSIDKDIRVGKWYKVTSRGLFEMVEKVAFADPVVLAFDIETTKAPLKFPDASIDQIMMISYMIDGDGFLITNREIISEDIEDFEYSPRPEYPGNFTIFNEDNEEQLLKRFFEHIRDVRPTIISTFNGDFFDWPFVDTRAKIHGLDLSQEIGFAPDLEGEYKSPYCTHMDCFRWVKRDSYLPQGSQGLKAVTQAKLGYNPIELDPELMTPYAYERPQHLSEYSVSDAVATYYLYMKYVHPFIFSLCTIIPLNPDEVLRKGTGTLCEMLLMVQAYKGNILLPNKHVDPIERFYDGHLLESETYVGGHVESLEAGVFRNDLKNEFKIDPTAIDELLADLPHALKFCVEVENNSELGKVTNLKEVEDQIKESLLDLKVNNERNELPLIYHVDVASMYPNIMITNRLQPDSVKSEHDCASCDFNRPGKQCDRRLKWSWRGEFSPAKMGDYNMVKSALQNEMFPNRKKNARRQFLTFEELSYFDQVSHIKKRLSDYSRKNYRKVKTSEVVEREAIICQRENPFYVNTVRSFRDRRYEFKGLVKVWKKKMSEIDSNKKHERDEAQKMIVLYDSLQLAHKVILNSFYGYVMRKGSRWYSMEMAGITCLTGATIIQMARALVERLGRPLELDTDGIWCILPESFPENFELKLTNGKTLYLSYPCSMLNYKVHRQFTNNQYQNLVDPINHRYEMHSDNSIFFEVDGPYRAMILPTSKEEGKGIKKRYAVFNMDGSLAELKGFELKRRGELQLIKNFQRDIFSMFLEGDTLKSCYAEVAAVANRWLDVLDSRGVMLEDEDLIELICENRSMSKTLKEYEGQKSTSITTARRLGDFLGEEMVKDKGLQCKYIISSKPAGSPVTERAIPVAIFSADMSTKRTFLRRWLVDASLDDFDPRAILDWSYYRERLASVVQKIITIPAALQNVVNPVPRVEHPDWLRKKIAISEDKLKQTSLTKYFKKTTKVPVIEDIEDGFGGAFSNEVSAKKNAKVISRKILKRRSKEDVEEESLVLPLQIPYLEDDYAGWLKCQKIKWKIQARDRKRRTQLFGNTSSASHRSPLGSIIRKQAETYANSTWEILQYKETSEPGVLEAQVLLDQKVHSLKFIIPKTVYINFKSDLLPEGSIKNCTVEKSSALLPNRNELQDSNRSTLFKLTLPEEAFLDEIQNSCSIVNDQGVLGMFESSITTTQRAIIELGSSVQFTSDAIGALGRGLQKGFERKSLQAGSCERYLEKVHFDVIYLLHVSTNVGYEYFILFKGWDRHSEIYVLKPSENAQDLSSSAIESLFKESCSRAKGGMAFNILKDFPQEITIEQKSFTNLSKLYKQLSQSISKTANEKGSRLVLLLQSPFIEKMKRAVKPLNILPLMELSIGEFILNPLNWQNTVRKKIVSSILSLNGWLEEWIALSRYSGIPICNLRLDKMRHIIDVMYARKLKRDDIVLWWNNKTPIPDYGGLEKDFNLTTSSFRRDLSLNVFNRQEVYDNVVFEIELKNLTVNTVLTSALINEAEGSDNTDLSSFQKDPSSGEGAGLVEDSFSNFALSVLRSLLKSLWDDAMIENRTADSLIHAFMEWINSSDSRLFDPSLQYHVHNLTKKALLQLVNVAKTLGSTVIFADRSKLLIKTSKTTVESSYAYGQYLIKAVRSAPMFNFLDLSIKKYWDLLIWMNRNNYAGHACDEIKDADEQDLRAYSEWHIRAFLPPIYQQEFDDWLIIILDSMVKAKESYLRQKTDSLRMTQIVHLEDARGVRDKQDPDFLQGFTSRFSAVLKDRIKRLLQNQQEYILDLDVGVNYQFPQLAGSRHDLKNPLLELVKYLCHIMLFGKTTVLEVRQLRKDLLKIFDMREFDPATAFKYPSASLVIGNLICEYCHSLDDIDFCLIKPNESFACSYCHRHFDTVLLQENLIQTLQIELQNYYTQDLRCVKCGKIKEDLLSEHCPCSGSWTATLNERQLFERIETYQNVATYCNFSLLDAVISDL
ncbi:LAMI_0F02410g1_1 [Lachancea mirantina]|uniref:DNA polymerase epsilon catalytic subunit n=1 Tax=Lachancea mirantina TaxID=1230905 RepID=A0A1G4JWH5_9SACH|nr:LAMI_0F02410g1_1 [Lachancea mirantina]